MKTAFFACCLMAALVTNSEGRIVKSAADLKRQILSDDLTPAVKTKLIPASAKTAFAQLVGDSRFRMANPGENYQLTDAGNWRGLPMRRLVFASVSEKYCVVHLEKGGRGHGYYVVVLKLDEGKAKFVWGAISDHELKGLDDFGESITRNKLDDELPYSW